MNEKFAEGETTSIKIGVGFAFLAVFYVGFLQFYNLGKLPIVQWDESRLAVNAAEMYLNKSYLVTTYENRPDLWNTKPPLMIWLQCGSMALFGINEWAVRFPSALAGFLCMIFLGFWMFKISKSYYWGGLAMLFLSVSGGFIQLHGSMTGDFDALLSLFVLLSVYQYTRFYFDGKKSSLLWMVAFVSLAAMSKSAAGLMIIPLLLVFPLVQKRWKMALKLSMALFLSVLPFLLFCFLRENASEGYLKQMWLNDFGGRFNEVIEGHAHPWNYYLNNLAFERLNYFVVFFIPAVLWFIFKKNLKLCFLSLFVAGFIFILSVSKTKIHWYDMPLLSIICLIITVFLFQATSAIKRDLFKKIALVLIPIAMMPSVIDKFQFIVYHKNLKLSLDHYDLSRFLRNYKEEEPLRYISLNYDPEYYFYTKANTKITRGVIGTFKLGEKVVFQHFLEPDFAAVYQYKVLRNDKSVKYIQIIGKVK